MLTEKDVFEYDADGRVSVEIHWCPGCMKKHGRIIRPHLPPRWTPGTDKLIPMVCPPCFRITQEVYGGDFVEALLEPDSIHGPKAFFAFVRRAFKKVVIQGGAGSRRQFTLIRGGRK